MKVRKAVFPAAGLGTRFLPATKAQPKEMLPLVDKPMIQYVVEEAVASGLSEIIIVTGRGKRAIEDHFDAAFELEYYLNDRGKTEELAQIKTISELASVSYVRQKEPLGLGHAILCARSLVGDEPFAVFLGDDIIGAAPSPCMRQLLDVAARYQGPVIAVERVPRERIHQYGVIAARPVEGRVHEILDLVESFREMAVSLMEVHLSSISNRLNEVMRVLTVISTIFIPLTFITSLYGMNFDWMPELRSPWGYPVVILAMVTLALLMILWFWRRGWLGRS